jgi:hypothetical protein
MTHRDERVGGGTISDCSMSVMPPTSEREKEDRLMRFPVGEGVSRILTRDSSRDFSAEKSYIIITLVQRLLETYHSQSQRL